MTILCPLPTRQKCFGSHSDVTSVVIQFSKQVEINPRTVWFAVGCRVGSTWSLSYVETVIVTHLPFSILELVAKISMSFHRKHSPTYTLALILSFCVPIVRYWGSNQPKLNSGSLHLQIQSSYLIFTLSAGLHSSFFTWGKFEEIFRLHSLALPKILSSLSSHLGSYNFQAIIFSPPKNPVRAP